MVRIRLFRIGKKNQPSYKIVVTPKENPPQGGNFLDKIGHYNPVTKECKIDVEKAKKWLSDGAQPSDTVHNLFVKEGIIKDDKRPKHKKSKKSEEEKGKEDKENESKEGEEEEDKDDNSDDDKKEKDKKEEGNDNEKKEEKKEEDKKEDKGGEEEEKEEDDKKE